MAKKRDEKFLNFAIQMKSLQNVEKNQMHQYQREMANNNLPKKKYLYQKLEEAE